MNSTGGGTAFISPAPPLGTWLAIVAVIAIVAAVVAFIIYEVMRFMERKKKARKSEGVSAEVWCAIGTLVFNGAYVVYQMFSEMSWTTRAFGDWMIAFSAAGLIVATFAAPVVLFKWMRRKR